MIRTYWATPHYLVNGRWLPESGYAYAIVAMQRKRGNPDLAHWCEGGYNYTGTDSDVWEPMTTEEK